MPDPHVLTAMAEAAARIADAIVRRESVAIFGDYDVDGATSAALLARFLRLGGIEPIDPYSRPAVRRLRPERRGGAGAGRRAARRCWSPSIAAPPASSRSQRRSALGLDVVVIDHHQADEELPPAVAIVNPNRRDDLSGLGHLAAVGLVFMTVVAVNRALRQRGFWTAERPEPDLLDTARRRGARHRRRRGAADRAQPRLRRQGAARAAPARAAPGHVSLMDVARLSGPPEAWHLGFLLGPRINAGGRIGRADLGVRLLIEDDPIEAGQNRRRA